MSQSTHRDQEATPLLGVNHASSTSSLRRVYFTSFLLSATFAITQTSLIYAFRTMTCDAWYAEGGEGSGVSDRCAIAAIDARSAREVAIMSTITTSCTIINLFLTGYWIKRFGVKAAFFQQTSWAAARNLCQIFALTIGGQRGIRIIQITQAFNIMGSGGGYLLASNAYIAVLSLPAERTNAFAVLQGVVMLGASLGYTFGGLVEWYFGKLAPFLSAFVLLIFCTVFGYLVLPKIDRQQSADTSKSRQSVIAPLKLFLPLRREGKRDFTLFLLATGTFFSVLATGYVPMALQLVGQNVFGFRPAQNGFMLSLDLLARAIFLSLVFPRIIHAGRHAMASRAKKLREDEPSEPSEEDVESEGTIPSPTNRAHGSAFELVFLQASILIDGILTGGVTFSSQGWHLYVASIVLPFASGTGPAAKGVTLDLVDARDRDDALAAIALIERLAQVSTTSIFGFLFALLSAMEKPTLVFAANAGVALIGFLFLLFVMMP